MKCLALMVVLLIPSMAWAQDNGANVTEFGDGGRRIVNDTWDRYIDGGRDANQGVNQSFGEVDGPQSGRTLTTGEGHLDSRDGEVPKCSGPRFEGKAC